MHDTTDTAATDRPDADAGQEQGGLWMSLSSIARLKGVARQTISEKVDRLERDGKISTRRGKGKVRLANLAEYDRALGEVTDLAREQAVRTRAEGAGASPTNSSYVAQQTRRARYAADLAELELKQRLGETVPVAEVVAAVELWGQRQVEIMDAAVRRASNADERAMLKRFVHDLRVRMAEAANEFVAGVTRQPKEGTEGTDDDQQQLHIDD